MGRFLGFFFLNCHTALLAIVGSVAFALLVLYDAHSLDVFATINARNGNIGTHCLMALDFFANTLCLAMPIRCTLNRCKFTFVVMSCHLLVLEHLSAPHGMVSTLELHLLELLFNLLLDTEELRLNTLHGTHACFVVKFLKALVMESILARLAFDGVN